MALADVVQETQEPCGLAFSAENSDFFKARLDALAAQCTSSLQAQGYSKIELEPFLHLRYDGTDCALMCAPASTTRTEDTLLASYGDFIATFLKRYRTEFGFVLQNRAIVVDDIRVRGLGKNNTPPELEIEKATVVTPKPTGFTRIFFEQGAHESPIYLTSSLLAGSQISGPAILIDQLSTILVEPDCVAEVTKHGDLVINVCSSNRTVVDCKLDAIQLSIFSHRFMSIAEQMGRLAYAKVYFDSSLKMCIYLKSAPTHVDFDQHQRAPRLLVRAIWPRWRSREQCAAHTRSLGRYAGDGAISVARAR